MANNFSLKRCLKLVKWNLYSDAEMNVKHFVTATAVIAFIIGLISFRDGTATDRETFNLYILSLVSVCSLEFYSLYRFSYAFGLKGNKHHSISYLMLPGNNIEKFIARLIYLFILGIVFIFGCYIASDLLRLLVLWILPGSDYGSMLPALEPTLREIINSSRPGDVKDAIAGFSDGWTSEGLDDKSDGTLGYVNVPIGFMSIVYFVSSTLCYTSICVLSSGLFNKFRFAMALIGFLLYSFVEMIPVGNSIQLPFYSVLNLIIAGVCLYYAYQLFKNKQLVNHNFINSLK